MSGFRHLSARGTTYNAGDAAPVDAPRSIASSSSPVWPRSRPPRYHPARGLAAESGPRMVVSPRPPLRPGVPTSSGRRAPSRSSRECDSDRPLARTLVYCGDPSRHSAGRTLDRARLARLSWAGRCRSLGVRSSQAASSRAIRSSRPCRSHAELARQRHDDYRDARGTPDDDRGAVAVRQYSSGPRIRRRSRGNRWPLGMAPAE